MSNVLHPASDNAAFGAIAATPEELRRLLQDLEIEDGIVVELLRAQRLLELRRSYETYGAEFESRVTAYIAIHIRAALRDSDAPRRDEIATEVSEIERLTEQLDRPGNVGLPREKDEWHIIEVLTRDNLRRLDALARTNESRGALLPRAPEPEYGYAEIERRIREARRNLNRRVSRLTRALERLRPNAATRAQLELDVSVALRDLNALDRASSSGAMPLLVDINVLDAAVNTNAYAALREAVANFLDAMGVGVHLNAWTQRGSILEAIVGFFRKKQTREEIAGIYQEGREALRAAVRDRKIAENVEILTKAAANVIPHLATFERVALRLGELLVIKTLVEGKPVLLVELVTPAIARKLDEDPLLLSDSDRLLGLFPVSARLQVNIAEDTIPNQ